MQQNSAPQLRFKDNDGNEFPDWEIYLIEDVSRSFFFKPNTSLILRP